LQKSAQKYILLQIAGGIWYHSFFDETAMNTNITNKLYNLINKFFKKPTPT
jgi:hypothetical protein